MSWLKFKCKYCGTSWIEQATSYSIYSSTNCKHCGDSRVTKKQVTYEKIDYYAQDPKPKGTVKEEDEDGGYLD